MVFPEAFPTTEERKRVATPLLPPEDIRFDPSPTAFFVCNRCLENLCIVDIISLLTANVGAKLRKRKQERKESRKQERSAELIRATKRSNILGTPAF